MRHFNTVQAHPNWEWDGSLSITGAQSLRTYRELKERQSKLPTHEYGIFFAFSKEQFKSGMKDLVSRGLLKDGEKIYSHGGGYFGIPGALERYMSAVEAIDKEIAEKCDPLEVYYEEYNNFECCLGFDGDLPAVKAVIQIFGVDIARQVLTDDKRFNRVGDVDGIAESMNNN